MQIPNLVVFRLCSPRFSAASAQNFVQCKHWTTLTLYSVVNKTGNKNKILEGQIPVLYWLHLVLNNYFFYVLYSVAQIFAQGSLLWSVPRLVFPRETGSRYAISEVCRFSISTFSGSRHHVFEPIILTKFYRVKIQQGNIVLQVESPIETNQKLQSNFRGVQILKLAVFRLWPPHFSVHR